MRDIQAALAGGEILVADGALGTRLLEAGLAPGDCPERLVFTRPDLIVGIARDYLDAGAEIIQTCTFGASPMKLAAFGLEERTEELNARAVALVREAVGDRAWIAGSCGPSGALLAPWGAATPDELGAGFERQIRALALAGVDLVIVETMSDLSEAVLAVAAARRVAPELPVAATLTFEATPRGFRTIMGTDIPSAARGLAAAGAHVVGANCGNGSELMTAVAREFSGATSLPLLFQANAGLPALEGERVVYRETPEFMAARAAEWIEAGARIVGGCCGTTPEHTGAMRRMVDARRAPRA